MVVHEHVAAVAEPRQREHADRVAARDDARGLHDALVVDGADEAYLASAGQPDGRTDRRSSGRRKARGGVGSDGHQGEFSGRWTAGDGRRAAGGGRRAAGDGRRATGDGRWATGDGRRATGDGRRAMGDGRWATGDGRRAMGDGRSGDGRWTADDGRRAMGDRHTAEIVHVWRRGDLGFAQPSRHTHADLCALAPSPVAHRPPPVARRPPPAARRPPPAARRPPPIARQVFSGFFFAAGNRTLFRMSRYPGEFLNSERSVGGLPIACRGSSGSCPP